MKTTRVDLRDVDTVSLYGRPLTRLISIGLNFLVFQQLLSNGAAEVEQRLEQRSHRTLFRPFGFPRCFTG